MKTKVLRKIGQFELNEGSGMAKGLYNVTNSILLEYAKDKGISLWFDEETKDLLMRCSEKEFIQRAKQYAGNDIPKFLKGDVVVIESLKSVGTIIDVYEEKYGYSYRTDVDGMREENELTKIPKELAPTFLQEGYLVSQELL